MSKYNIICKDQGYYKDICIERSLLIIICTYLY